MGKSLLFALGLLACATSAEAAEVWTCTYTDEGSLVRFAVSPPDLIDGNTHEHYRILQNNDYGLVATLSVSGIQEWQKAGNSPAVGAVSIVVNKGTGEFWWNNTFAGAAPIPNGSAHGQCLKD